MYPTGYQQSPSYYGYLQGSSTWQSQPNTPWGAQDTQNASAWPSQPYQYATAPGHSHYPQYVYSNPQSTYPLQQKQTYAYYPPSQASTMPTVAPKRAPQLLRRFHFTNTGTRHSRRFSRAWG
ncbi:hypothetical protein PLICRDRAFT_37402 [Plicaturopsis crispa FD-325 SS-3]|nr:hypothetical protein PLICRDRAFT_37402 [Plicaturopsis crispa FD-325 SS-3]